MRMLARFWWFFVAVCDWKTLLRYLRSQPIVDVVFISNLRDQTDRDRSFGSRNPLEGHVNGPRYWFGNVSARIRVIDTMTEELNTVAGVKKAKRQFVSAVCWAQKNGARVVLLAARTKRLFGEHGEELKDLFPEILFTIGDNGTSHALRLDTLRALQSARLQPTARVLVIGPTGFLGTAVSSCLIDAGYSVVGLCSSAESARRCRIEAYASFPEIGKVDAVIACSHGKSSLLTASIIETIRRKGRKLLVVDPAEPSNLTPRQYLKSRAIVVRQDAGNAFSSRLRYVMGAVSYKMLRMTEGVVFGCFAESLVLMREMRVNRSILDFDGFSVTEENIRTVGSLFEKYGFEAPTPRCFGREVETFNLDLVDQSQPVARMAPPLAGVRHA